MTETLSLEGMPPRALSILLTLYWLKSTNLVAGKSAFEKKTVARHLRSLVVPVKDPAHARLLPSGDTMSWLLRHGKKIDKRFATLSANGYAWITAEGIQAAERLISTGNVGIEPQANCPTCHAPLAGRALNGWQAYYKCGRASGFAATGYVPVYYCPNADIASHSLATGDAPHRGMPVRYALRYSRPDDDMAQDIPRIGRIAGIYGSLCVVDLEGRLGDTTRLIPSRLLVEAGKPDTTALSDNQIHVLSRLSDASAVISRRTDGRPTIKSVPGHRLGHITCTPQTWDALRRSGALEAFLTAAESAA